MPSRMKCKTMVGPGKKYKTMSECLSYGGMKMGKVKKPKMKSSIKMGGY